MKGLNALDSIISNSGKPKQINFIKHLFFSKGIDLNQFNKLPIPYILEMVEVDSWIKKEEQKAAKKANRK